MRFSIAIVFVFIAVSIAVSAETNQSFLLHKWNALQSDLLAVHELYLAVPQDQVRLKAETDRVLTRWHPIAVQLPPVITEGSNLRGPFGYLLSSAVACVEAVSRGAEPKTDDLGGFQNVFCSVWRDYVGSPALPAPLCQHWFVKPTAANGYEAEVVAEWNWLQSALYEMHCNMTGQPPDITWLKQRCDQIVLRTSGDTLKWQEKSCPADMKMFHERFYSMISFSGTALQEIESAYEKSDRARFIAYGAAVSDQQRKLLAVWPKSFAPPKVLKERWFEQ